MKQRQYYYFAFIIGFSLFAFGGCATGKSGSMESKEGVIETTTKAVNNPDHAGQRVDADISKSIKIKFGLDELISDSDIHVDTSHRHVTLQGSVDTQVEVDRAVKLGRSVDGVRSVHSNIIVN